MAHFLGRPFHRCQALILSPAYPVTAWTVTHGHIMSSAITLGKARGYGWTAASFSILDIASPYNMVITASVRIFTCPTTYCVVIFRNSRRRHDSRDGNTQSESPPSPPSPPPPPLPCPAAGAAASCVPELLSPVAPSRAVISASAASAALVAD